MSTTNINISESGGKAGPAGQSKATAKNRRKKQIKSLAQVIAQDNPKSQKKVKKTLKKMFKKFNFMSVSPSVDESYLFENFKDEIHDMAQHCDSVACDLLKKYIACQMNPEAVQCQIPDSDNRESFIIKSVSEDDVTVQMTATNGGIPGRFAGCFQPKLGNFGNPLYFRHAKVTADTLANGNQSSFDYTSTGPYETADPVSFVDPRVDPNFVRLTQKQLGVAYAVGGTAGTSASKPFGDGTQITFPTNQGSTGLVILYNGTTGLWQFPIGQYFVEVFINGNAAVTNIVSAGTATSTILEGIFNSGGTQGMHTFYVNAYDSAHNTFGATLTGAVTTVTQSRLRLSTIILDNVQNSTDYGVVEEYRYVAASGLFTCTVTDYDKGGRFAHAMVPNCAARSAFFTNQPQGSRGILREYSALAMVSNNEYAGRLEDGGFSWIPHLNSKDREYRSPTSMDVYDTPAWIYAGVWEPQSAASVTGLHVIGRVRTVLLIECLTIDQSYTTSVCAGSQAIIDEANKFYSTGNNGRPYAHCMTNGKHLDWFKSILAKVASIASTVGKVAEAGLPILAALA